MQDTSACPEPVCAVVIAAGKGYLVQKAPFAVHAAPRQMVRLRFYLRSWKAADRDRYEKPGTSNDC